MPYDRVIVRGERRLAVFTVPPEWVKPEWDALAALQHGIEFAGPATDRPDDEPATGSPSTPALEQDLTELKPAGRGCLLGVALLGALWTAIALLVLSRMNG